MINSLLNIFLKYKNMSEIVLNFIYPVGKRLDIYQQLLFGLILLNKFKFMQQYLKIHVTINKFSFNVKKKIFFIFI